MLNQKRYDNSMPDGMGVLEVGRERNVWFIPLQRTELEGVIGGPVAELALTQVFIFSKTEMPKVVEALYRFPLPGDAAITGVVVRFGEVEIIAELKERAKAEKEYGKAKKKGKKAALITRESPDVFTLSIAGIKPDEEVRIRTNYVQVGEPDGIGFSFRMPLTTSPRFVREDERYSRQSNGQPLALLRDPGHRFNLNLKVKGGMLTSPTYELATNADGEVRLSAGEVIPDRDCVLTWQPEQDGSKSTLRLFTDGTKNPAFLALITPPKAQSIRIKREVIVLVDHSGSMSGAKWKAADWAVEKFLHDLGSKDLFNLGLFHNETKWFSPMPVSATEEAVSKAVAFLHDASSGGTELGGALSEALAQPKAEGTFARHILLLTDAEVTDEARILAMVEKEAKSKDRRRCSIICIDSAPNSFLAKELAEKGRGVAKFLTSSPKEGDITTSLDAILELWAAPIVSDMHLLSNRRPLVFDQKGDDGFYHIPVGDLISGRSSWVVGKLGSGRGRPDIKLNGSANIETIEMKAVGALLAAKRINGLELLINLDHDLLDEVDSLSALGFETKDVEAAKKRLIHEGTNPWIGNIIRSLVVNESLENGIISSETAFVAIRNKKGKMIEGTVIIPNALPHGWDEEFAMKSAVSSHNRSMSSIAPILNEMGTFKRSAMPAGFSSGGTVAASQWSVFDGVPTFANDEAVLYDGAFQGQEGSLFETLTISLDKAVQSGPKMNIAIYIGDLSVPRIKVALDDIIKNGGIRPINMVVRRHERVKIALTDPDGQWMAGGWIKVGLS